jgi:hypothetical protein
MNLRQARCCTLRYSRANASSAQEAAHSHRCSTQADWTSVTRPNATRLASNTYVELRLAPQLGGHASRESADPLAVEGSLWVTLGLRRDVPGPSAARVASAAS